MKKRILSLLLALIILCSFVPSALAEDEIDFSSTEFYQLKIDAFLEIIGELGLYYEDSDDYLEAAIEVFMANHPEISGNLTARNAAAFFAVCPEYFEEFANTLFQLHDKHSHYMEAVTYEDSYSMEETYVGIGIELDTAKSKGFFVFNVIPGTPADEAGMLAGDEIIEVEGVNVTKMHYSRAAELLRGEAGTTVSFKVKRGEQVLSFTLERREIVMSNVEFSDLGDGVAYIRVTRFGDIQTYLDFIDIYQNLPYDGFRSVIIDLRYNLGGSFDTALNMLNYTFWEADLPMFNIYSRDSGLEEYTSLGAGWKPNSLCILVNEYSASASELYAGALQANGFATVIGVQTYGKGVGQYHIPLVDDSNVIITNFEIRLGASDESYNGVGITPDIIVRDDQYILDASSFETLNRSRILYYGCSGNDVLALEQRLEAFGYFYETPDTRFDAATVAAMNLFQQENELPVVSYTSHTMLARLDGMTKANDGQVIYVDNTFGYAYEIALEAAREPLDYELAPRTFEEYNQFYGTQGE